MGNTHMKQKVVISALAGMILIPGSAVPVKAAEEPEQGQPLLPAAGIEAVLEECYETEVKDNINLYLVPTEEGEYLNMAFSAGISRWMDKDKIRDSGRLRPLGYADHRRDSPHACGGI